MTVSCLLLCFVWNSASLASRSVFFVCLEAFIFIFHFAFARVLLVPVSTGTRLLTLHGLFHGISCPLVGVVSSPQAASSKWESTQVVLFAFGAAKLNSFRQQRGCGIHPSYLPRTRGWNGQRFNPTVTYSHQVLTSTGTSIPTIAIIRLVSYMWNQSTDTGIAPFIHSTIPSIPSLPTIP